MEPPTQGWCISMGYTRVLLVFINNAGDVFRCAWYLLNKGLTYTNLNPYQGMLVSKTSNYVFKTTKSSKFPWITNKES